MREKEENRLRIRKGTEEPQSFHYSRRERLALPSAPHSPEKQGFFRRNRGLFIILLDVVILAILGLAFSRMLWGASYRAKIAGYSVVLRGFPTQDAVIATLTVKKIGGSAERGQRVVASISIGQWQTFLSAELSKEDGAETILRHILPAEPEEDELRAEVRIGDGIRYLSRDLKRRSD